MLPFFLQTHVPVLGPLEVPSYFLMVTVAFLVGTSLAVRDGRRDGFKVIDILDGSLVVLAAGLIGSRLGHVFLESPWIQLNIPAQSNAGWQHIFCRMAGESHAVARPWNLGWYYLLHPQMVFAVWNGGMVLYTGLMLCAPAMIWFCRVRKIAFWRIADLSAAPTAAGIAFGRLGCLLAGCCHGHPIQTGSLKAFGIVIPNSSFGDSILWPTQLMESMVTLGLCWLCYQLWAVRKFDGMVFLSFAILYGIWRPIVEELRGDDQRIFHAGLSTSQWISVLIVSGCLALLPVLWRRRVRPATLQAT